MPSEPLFDLALADPTVTAATLEDLRAANPQRFEMEQLSRICYVDVPLGQVAGVLDVPDEPWWARGHIPDRPLMPGVLMIEAAAQLCSYFVRRVYDAAEYGGRFFGFGGIDDVKFRGTVFPGQTLIILGQKLEIRPRRAVFRTQGYVEGRMCVEATITGMWV
jgi:3-hydroxyacyl-[acyl-carrier-protein] dehydratase